MINEEAESSPPPLKSSERVRVRVSKELDAMNIYDVDLRGLCDLLRVNPLFRFCSGASVVALASRMKERRFSAGDAIAVQNAPQRHMYLLVEGTIARERTAGGVTHTVDQKAEGNVFGAHHFLRADPCYATLRCVDDCIVYELSSDDFRDALVKHSTLPEEIIYGLNKIVRKQSKLMRTPLLRQTGKPTQLWATSLAASMEAFYRSALNSLLIGSLGSTGRPPLFPMMHIQVPTRVLYINGFKEIRKKLEEFDLIGIAERSPFPNAVLLMGAFTPGLIMCPFSSVLEACNATAHNPEPLQTRWLRGYVPRCAREILFGVGLNQLSDWMEERISGGALKKYPSIENALGSIGAGVVSGYLSQTPHNLSTLKLMNPRLTYAQHFAHLARTSLYHNVPWDAAAHAPPALGKVLAVIAPKGCFIRSLQIAGSFVILNGIISFFDRRTNAREQPSNYDVKAKV